MIVVAREFIPANHKTLLSAGLHLEIDPRGGGKMSIYEKVNPVYMWISTYTRGSGGMLSQEILAFRLSETASGAFSGTVSLVFIKKFWKKLFSTDVVETGIERLIVAISRGARFDQGGQVPPAPPK